jgi:hypothetical protein
MILKTLSEVVLEEMLDEHRKRLDELFANGDTESQDFYYYFNMLQKVKLELEFRKMKKITGN